MWHSNSTGKSCISILNNKLFKNSIIILIMNFSSIELFNILLHSSANDIIRWCSINLDIYELCNSEFFWRSKLALDYPNVPPKPADVSWKYFYLAIHFNKLRYIPIIVNNIIGDYIWIRPTDTYV